MTLTAEQIKELQREYDKAVTGKKHSFVFLGREILTSYAKYMLEYIKGLK